MYVSTHLMGWVSEQSAISAPSPTCLRLRHVLLQLQVFSRNDRGMDHEHLSLTDQESLLIKSTHQLTHQLHLQLLLKRHLQDSQHLQGDFQLRPDVSSSPMTTS